VQGLYILSLIPSEPVILLLTFYFNLTKVNIYGILKLLLGTNLDGDDVSKPDPEVVPNHSVHPYLLVRDGVIRQHNANALLAFLALNKTRFSGMSLRNTCLIFICFFN
jgi:hypothetical protein